MGNSCGSKHALLVFLVQEEVSAASESHIDTIKFDLECAVVFCDTLLQLCRVVLLEECLQDADKATLCSVMLSKIGL